MKFLVSMCRHGAVCSAQNAIQRGEQVFAKTCATGYCHGVEGRIERRSAAGGAGLQSGVYR